MEKGERKGKGKGALEGKTRTRESSVSELVNLELAPAARLSVCSSFTRAV